MSRDDFTIEEFEEFVVAIREIKEAGALLSPLPAVTISRDSGARGVLTAHALKQYLDATEKTPIKWKVFEANLVDILLKRNSLPSTLASRMKEDKVGLLHRIKNIFERAPSDHELFKRTKQLLNELLDLGQSIIIGRGADFLGSNRPQILKVKLLVSEETAIRRIAKDEGISRHQAAELRLKRDTARAAYVRTHYNKNYHNLDHFDLVIHTDELRVVEVAEKIGRAVRSKSGLS